MKCYNCGKDMKEGETVCPFCGAEQGADEDLVAKAKEGDQQAIADLYQRSYNNVYYTVKSMIRDGDTIQDLVQDTFVQAFQSLDTLKEPSRFQAWVRTIAHNRTVNYINKKKPILFSEMTSPDGEEEEPVFVDEDLDHMPEEVIDQQETARLIQEILDSLSEEQRIAVGMYYYEQYSVREIAGIMGVSENTVKSRLNYGRKKIEVRVRELEKKGTKLYGLAPIPFLLFLFRSQNAEAASAPDGGMLQSIQEALRAAEDGSKGAKAAATAGKTAETAEKTAAAVGAAAKTGGTATKIAGLALNGLAAKIAVGVAVVVLLGGTAFYVANRSGRSSETAATEAELSETTAQVQTETQTETETESIPVLTGTGVMQSFALTQADFGNTNSIGAWGNENLKRSDIETITFLNSQEDIPDEEAILAAGGNEATVPWDISQDGDGSVTAWATDENGDGLYELYVAGTGTIYVNADSSYLFAYYTNLKTLEFGDNFDTSNVVTMASMFEGCASLTELNLTGLDTSSVMTMASMFEDCQSLASLNLTGLNTAAVTSMASMFAGCNSLTELNLTGIDTSSVTTMASMFEGCRSLAALDLSGFDTVSVTDMSEMFADCFALSELTLTAANGSFYTGNVARMSEMFRGCISLTALDLAGFDTSKVTTMRGMFQGCTALGELLVDSFNTSAVADFAYMFESCAALKTLDVSRFVTSAATDMSGMFSGCSGLTELDVSGFDTSQVRNMGSMFYGCTALKSLTLGDFDTANVVDMSYMFAGLDSGLQEELKEITANFETSKANLLGWFE